jgi:predicted HicB family RNase H-like nuclease
MTTTVENATIPKTTKAEAPEEAPAVVSINVPLPAWLHRQLRIRAATEGTSLKECVIAALESYVTSP